MTKMPVRCGALGAVAFALTIAWAVPAGAETELENLQESIDTATRSIDKGLQNLAEATFDGAETTHTIIPEVVGGLNFAREAIAQGKFDLAADALSVAKGMIEVALKALPDPPAADLSSVRDMSLEGEKARELAAAGITAQDIANVQGAIERMAQDRSASVENVGQVMARLDAGGFDVARLEDVLEKTDSSADEVVASINLDFSNLQSLAASLSDIMNDPDMVSQLSREAGRVFAQMGTDLNTIAGTIASAVSAGASVDLESLAQGAGFDNFADAVNAYNAAYGTNYTEQQARDALGM